MQDNEEGSGRQWRIPIRPHPALTRRQNELAALVAEGLSISEVAEALQVERCTVSSCLRRIAARLDLPEGSSRKRVLLVRHLLAYSFDQMQEEELAA